MAAASLNALNQRSKMPRMVRADQIDPSQGPATFMDPTARLRELTDLYEMHPGRAPEGSGTTGLQSGDKHGYSQMLNERLQFMRLLDLADGGRGEVDVRADPRSNRRSSFVPHENDPRLPMRDPFRADRDFFSAPGASLANSRSSLGALRSRGGF
jgi:hypothetical protein